MIVAADNDLPHAAFKNIAVVTRLAPWSISMHCYLGIDIGTTAVEAAAIGLDGSLIKSSEVMIETIRPRAGWSEQDPDA